MSLQLTVIGCWSPYPPAGSACSAYLVESAATSLLLDCGHGVMSQLFRYIKPEKLSGVVITHSHPDHASDLPALRHYWRSRRFLGQDLAPLPVWLPPGDQELEHWQRTPELNAQAAVGTINCGDLKLEFTAGKHSLPVTMVRIAAGRKTIFYTGDTAYLDRGINSSQGCDLLVAECTLPPEEEHLSGQLGHLTWTECGRWGTECSCARLLATHFWPEYNVEEIAAAVARTYHGELIMAKPGLKVEV